jgi:hypothetical protein
MTTKLTPEQREIAIARLQDIADEARYQLQCLLNRLQNPNPKVIIVTNPLDAEYHYLERDLTISAGIRVDN